MHILSNRMNKEWMQGNQVLRGFSKEHSQDERNELAEKVRKIRKDRYDSKRDDERKRAVSGERVEQHYMELGSLAKELEGISGSSFLRVINFLRIIKVRAEIETISDSIKKEKREMDSSSQKKQEESEFLESKKLIEDFYRTQEEKWNKLPFHSEDIERYFDPQYLATCSMEEYVLILRRFGGDMVTHVTRQGVRDHFGMMEHARGVGEFSNGFREMLSDGILKHNLALCIGEEQRDERVADYFNLEHCSREQALIKLDSFVDVGRQHSGGSFVDYHAVHFAVASVADAYYGSEKGNEIFVAYPSNMMAAHYLHRRDAHIPMDASNYNDLWVYLKQDDEIPVNSGIVFIPANAFVDPRTGSQYEMGDDGIARADVEYADSILGIVEAKDFGGFSQELREFLGSTRYSYAEFLKNDFNYRQDFREKKIEFDKLVGEIRERFPTINQKQIETIMDYRFLFNLGIANSSDEFPEIINSRLVDLGLYYKKVDKAITSKEYWEEFFTKNPDTRPVRIVYYEETDPTDALYKWKFQHCLINQEKGGDTFNKEILKTTILPDVPDLIRRDLEMFRSLVEGVIERYYTRD